MLRLIDEGKARLEELETWWSINDVMRQLEYGNARAEAEWREHKKAEERRK